MRLISFGRLLMTGMLTLLVLSALACGGTAEPTERPSVTEPPKVVDPPTPGPVEGEAIFTGPVGGCGACHTIEGLATGLVGPDLTHIGTDAETRKPGASAEDYIRESIKDPEAFVAEGVERATAGLMLGALTANLTDGQVDALVEFLLEQK